METKHTPAEAAEILAYISGPSKRTAEVCVRLDGDIAKTAFDAAIRACNSHDALVAKFRAIELRVDNLKSGGDVQKALEAIKRHCREALAAAQVQP
jgi:hypothetical protein